MVAIDRWGSAQEQTFVQADSLSVTFLKLALPITDAAKRALKNAVLYHPDDVAGVPAGRAVRIDELELAPGGVRLRGARIADLDAVVERVPRDNVVSIARRSGHTGSGKAAAIGIGVGLGVGLLSIYQLGMPGLVVMPAAGGVAGYVGSLSWSEAIVVYSRQGVSALRRGGRVRLAFPEDDGQPDQEDPDRQR